MNGHPPNAETLDLYALGLLTPEERDALEQHLATDCPLCREELRRANALAAAIGAGVEPVAPSARVTAALRQRLGPASRSAPAAGRWRWAAAVIVLAVAAGWFGWQARRLAVVNRSLRSERNALQERMRSAQRDAASWREALALIAAPDTRVVQAHAAPAKPAAKAFFSARQLLLIGWRLPPLPANKTYEMWRLPRHGAPIPAGLFRADAAGSAQHLAAGDWGTAAAVAVSVEPAGGRPQPTGPIVLVAKLAR